MELVSKHEKENVTSKLVDDIIFYNILLRVPAKSLLRFKCVSKDWYNRIRSSIFNAAFESYNSDDIIIVSHDFRGRFSLCTYCETSHLLSCKNVAFETNTSSKIVSSCKGFICPSSRPDELVLCNPLTREFRRLIRPPPLQINMSPIQYTYSFGYDFVSHTYKIVKFTIFGELPGQNMIFFSILQLYNASTNLWTGKKIPLVATFWGFCVTLKNSLHWLASSPGNRQCISVFDLNTEEFREIEFSDRLKKHEIIDLMVSDRILYAITGTTYRVLDEIWVMEEYGVPTSWKKLHDDLYRENNCFKLAELVTYKSRKEGAEALLEKFIRNEKCHDLIWYNFGNKSIRKIKDSDLHQYYGARSCNASVAPLP